VLRDRGEGSLADVVDRALVEVTSRGADRAVVLMADLPRIEPGDVRELLAALDDYDVALVRDHVGRHTNALAIAPPTAMATCFGRDDSFAAHCEAARAAGLRTLAVQNDRIAFDVDLPADHRRLTKSRPATGT
jgi:2-phospho-L-lactate guanylyltransferase (CobY/MobA/RfbA family)